MFNFLKVVQIIEQNINIKAYFQIIFNAIDCINLMNTDRIIYYYKLIYLFCYLLNQFKFNNKFINKT